VSAAPAGGGGHDSRKVVIAALAGNLAIAAFKFLAAYLSHSTATLAEAVHSLADTGNQALLLVGMRLAARPASDRFPFGRSSEKYFWPFVVALLLFSVGGAFAIFEGVTQLLEPPATRPGSALWSYGVLGLSILLESASFKVAYTEFKLLAAGKGWREAILRTRDPTIPLVLAEDSTALVGLAIALVAVALSRLTGLAFFDPLGSVVIGVVLCAVAITLAWVTHGLLIGESASPDDQREALELAEGTPGVLKVTQLLTMHLGPDVVILALKVAFDPELRLAQIEAVTNTLEERLRAKMPHMRKIFVEADSAGDGRGTLRDGKLPNPASVDDVTVA
jgi:cation diffusion facilitator family transporter